MNEDEKKKKIWQSVNTWSAVHVPVSVCARVCALSATNA